METEGKISKRQFMRSSLGVGTLAVAAAATGAAVTPVNQAYAQLLDSGIDPNSVLAKIKSEGRLRIGVSYTVGVWAGKNPTTGELEGAYVDAARRLCSQLEVEPEFIEVSFGNVTVGLRNHDFDVAGSSYTYTIARALVADFIGPLWRRGWLAVTHKDNAERFKTAADLNNADVTFAVDAGSSEEALVKSRFPLAQMISTTGGAGMRVLPVQSKQADAYVGGDVDVNAWATRNDWAYVIDPANPMEVMANTWMVRYGDPDWKRFLDFWADSVVSSGFMKERVEYHQALWAQAQ